MGADGRMSRWHLRTLILGFCVVAATAAVMYRSLVYPTSFVLANELNGEWILDVFPSELVRRQSFPRSITFNLEAETVAKPLSSKYSLDEPLQFLNYTIPARAVAVESLQAGGPVWLWSGGKCGQSATCSLLLHRDKLLFSIFEGEHKIVVAALQRASARERPSILITKGPHIVALVMIVFVAKFFSSWMNPTPASRRIAAFEAKRNQQNAEVERKQAH